MEIEVTNDKENILIGRREVECIFKGNYGGFSRADAVQALSKKINATNKKIYSISIKGESGLCNAKGLFYIYDNEETASKDISKYIIDRNTPKKTDSSEESSATPSVDKASGSKKPVAAAPKTKSPEKAKDQTKTPKA